MRNQPEEFLEEVLKIISDMVYSIYLKFVLISGLLTLTGLTLFINIALIITKCQCIIEQ